MTSSHLRLSGGNRKAPRDSQRLACRCDETIAREIVPGMTEREFDGRKQDFLLSKGTSTASGMRRHPAGGRWNRIWFPQCWQARGLWPSETLPQGGLNKARNAKAPKSAKNARETSWNAALRFLGSPSASVAPLR